MHLGLAESTRRTYSNAWSTFSQFADEYKVTITLPVSETVLIAFVAHLSGKWNYKAINVALAAVRSKHVDIGLNLRLEDMVGLKRVVQGIKYSSQPQRHPERRPITVEVLQKLKAALNLSWHDDRLFWAVACVAVYGMFRLGELFGVAGTSDTTIKCSQVIITSPEEIQVYLPRSKTDKNREGASVSLYLTGGTSCPVTAVTQYMNNMIYNFPGNEPFFLKKDRTPATRSWVIDKLRSQLQAVGLDPSKYTGHSFRSGGATSLHGASVDGDTIKQMGRWRSQAYQQYIKVDNQVKKKAQLSIASRGVGGFIETPPRSVSFGDFINPRPPPRKRVTTKSCPNGTMRITK